jgi:hypothetical protein
MAGLEVRDGRYNIILRFGGKRFVRSLKTNDEDTALARKLRVEENIKLVDSGRLQIPEGADVVTFLLSDGKLSKKPVARTSITLTKLFTDFFDELPTGSLEESTIGVMKIHQRHLERIIGKRFIVQDLTNEELQKYATKRSKQKTGNAVRPATFAIPRSAPLLRSSWIIAPSPFLAAMCNGVSPCWVFAFAAAPCCRS